MNTFIITARTVEEAYAIANTKYADDKHEVSCEVIEMPKKGFLGIGSKDAKIKVTVTESASADLGSLVSDMRDMKKFTDRDQRDQKKQQNQNNRKEQNRDRKPQNNAQTQPQQKKAQPQNNQQNQQGQSLNTQQKPNAPKNQNQAQKQPAVAKVPEKSFDKNEKSFDKGAKKPETKPQNQSNRQPKVESKPVQIPAKPVQATEAKAQANNAQPKRNALKNSAKPNTRPQIKHVHGDNVNGASITVSSPVGLTDFVADNKKNSFGNGNRAGGSMSNDIRRKKPAKVLMAADKADEKMRASKYDVAESDEDYRSLKSMELENEALLEREAGAALGLSEALAKSDVREEAEADVQHVAESIEPASHRMKEAVTQAEMDYALEFANTLLSNMSVKAQAVACECPEGEEFITTDEATVYPKIEIIGEETGIIIGHHGETLDAVQYLVNLSALRKTKSKDGDYVKIVVDTENYREKRADTLRSLARRMAAKAVKYKRNVFLEPMNAYERRIIHSELQNYPNVSTHSVGTDRDRKIVITYEGDDKQADNRSRRRDRRPNHAKPADKAAASVQISATNDAEHAERRRPRKIQKVPIENLTDILEGEGFFGGSSSTDEE